MHRPIRTFVDVKDLPLCGGGDSVGCWTVWVDDQGVVLLLVRRKCDFDEVWVCFRVLWNEPPHFLYGSFSFGT